jgi:hypothetical protein
MEGFDSDNRERQEASENSRIKICDRAESAKRLQRINSEREFQSYVYPCLLEVAGHELPAVAIAGTISLAIDRLGDRSNPTSQLIRMFIPHFVDAMVDDPREAEQVMRVLNRPR